MGANRAFRGGVALPKTARRESAAPTCFRMGRRMGSIGRKGGHGGECERRRTRALAHAPPAAAAPGRAGAPAAGRLPHHAAVPGHVHAGDPPHGGLLRHRRGNRQPDVVGLLPALRRGHAGVRTLERQVRPTPDPARRIRVLRGRRRRLRALPHHPRAHRRAPCAGGGRGRGQRGVHGGGEGLVPRRPPREDLIHHAGALRHRPRRRAEHRHRRAPSRRLARHVLGALRRGGRSAWP